MIIYNLKINALRDSLVELYLLEKQQSLTPYPIFMAIAEKIGYDATGRSITENDLKTIGKYLKEFINKINFDNHDAS